MAEDVGQTKPGWRTGSFDWTVGKQPLPPGTAPSVPRRSFLGALLAVGGAATAAALAVPIIRFVLYPLRNTTTEVQWSDIGPASDFASLTAPMRTLITVEQVDGIHKLLLAGGIPVCARAVVVATGAQYRKLTVQNYENYENRGLFYAATAMESILCRDKDVIVVGGGNSAGQAAMYLSGIARHVYHIVRGPSLAATMSQYLVSRIERSSRISLCTNSEIVAGHRRIPARVALPNCPLDCLLHLP